MSFLIYAFIVYLIHLYTVSGRNAATQNAENIETSRSTWYARVPNTDIQTPTTTMPLHVIGEEDEEEMHR